MSGKQFLNEDKKNIKRMGSKTTKRLLDLSHDRAISSNHIQMMNLFKDETIKNKVQIAVLSMTLNRYFNNQYR